MSIMGEARNLKKRRQKTKMENKAKGYWIGLRFTAEEKEQVRNDAYAHRMNMTRYIKYLIEKERKEANNG